MTQPGEAEADRAARLTETLTERGVRGVALTIVDNAGVTRTKTVPVGLLGRTARWGVGLTPAFDVMMVNDWITTSPMVGGPTGDLRLIPDLAALRILPAQPGWAWAPADQHTQEDEVFPCCQRSFLKRMVAAAADAGIELRVGCEIEWFLGREEPDGRVTPAHDGPAYGAAALAELSDYCRDLVAAFDEQEAGVEQFHPEYAVGQLEISLGHRDPVGAADLNVLVRQTIRALSLRDGWRASFAPVVIPGQVGNGGHVHLSLWREGKNLFAGGRGPHGMTADGEAFVAGILTELPALTAVGSPSIASYLRLVPSHWAGPFACWGRENREAAIRFITGTVGARERAANVEVKCFDLSANPYLILGCLIAAGLSGVDRGLKLPPEFTDDPVSHPEAELESLGIRRLPRSLDEALEHLEKSSTLREALGEMEYGAFAAVRRAEQEAFGGQEPEAIAAAHRWRY